MAMIGATRESAAANAATLSTLFGALLVSLAASSWGTWSLFLRPTGLPASVTAPIALLLIGAFTLLFVPLDRTKPRWSRKALLWLGAVAICDAVNLSTFFAAMDRTSLAIAVLTHYLAPLIVAFVAPWSERERVPGATVAALVATVGLILVLQPWQASRGAWVGGALGTISAFAYAGVVLGSRRLIPEIGPARTLGLHALLSGLLVLPVFGLPDLGAIAGHAWLRLAIGSLLPGAVAGLVFLRGLDRIGSSRASILTFLEPIVAVALGVFVWRESLAISGVLGVLVIIAAGAFVASRRAVPLA